MLKIEIFAIDDEKGMTDLLDAIFKMNGIEHYRLFNDPYELLENLNPDVHICIVDYILKGKMNGLELIKKIVEKNKHCWFIMLSGQGDTKVIIDYMNSVYGSRYIEKGSAVPLQEAIMFHLRDIIKQIYFIDDFYRNANRIKEAVNDIKRLLT